MELTPKEKAKELIEKFKPHSHFWVHDFGHKKDYDIEQLENAVECALIAVDEIINSSPSLPILSDAGNFVSDIEESTEFWQEVKEELLKM